MVLTRSQRRAAQEKFISDDDTAVDNAPAAVEPPVLRSSSSLAKLADAAHLVRSHSWRHIERHIELAASGDHPLDIQFSWVVAISSFFYLAVSASYYSYEYYKLGALFSAISVLSLFADSVAPKNKLVNSLDRVFASLGFILSPLRVMLVPGVASLQVRGMTWVLGLIAAVVLAWSRASPDQSSYTVRHTIWHAVSAASLVWLAEVKGRGELLEPLAFHLPKWWREW